LSYADEIFLELLTWIASSVVFEAISTEAASEHYFKKFEFVEKEAIE
jgi:hypothetical protein